MRNYFTGPEITLCTYAALYEATDFGGIEAIAGLTARSKASIKMKIANIASMLDEEGIARHNSISPLTGLTTGKRGRRSNWDEVKQLVGYSKVAHLEKCSRIVQGTACLSIWATKHD